MSSRIVRTDPRDVVRVESKMCICIWDKFEMVCHMPDGIKPIMGNWIHPDDEFEKLRNFEDCMIGQSCSTIFFSVCVRVPDFTLV